MIVLEITDWFVEGGVCAGCWFVGGAVGVVVSLYVKHCLGEKQISQDYLNRSTRYEQIFIEFAINRKSFAVGCIYGTYFGLV